ncbi:MAG: NAD(P)/FAD-dependent oxidoreductase [Candidatus Borkfalkiaceae bacterium]|nr:NAD(P)/FAD-dependent oxidoreductase [Clostridia bacterium]MDY6223074.1 NAD(P)/FAD-dependent oxidoreductase [Christensenellaceae bacterium]
MKRVCVIGGGASGMMAACVAAENGNEVFLIEKNEKLGKKIYITGKGRCNLTNDVPPADFLTKVVHGGKFLYSAAYSFTPQNCMEFFSSRGLALKTERGGRVFPLSDHASDVTVTLERACVKAGVKIFLNETVTDLLTSTSPDIGIMPRIVAVKTDKREFPCEVAVVCTGGVSYPSTGSTGDGYAFAKKLGLKLTEPRPALCGINLKPSGKSGDYFKEAQGLSLKNVTLSATAEGKKIYANFGEMLFTHFGVSGPVVLSLSSLINRRNLNDVRLFLDFKPALDVPTLEKRLLRLFDEYKNKTLQNAAAELLPHKIISAVLSQADISPEKRCNSVTKEERERLIKALKAFEMQPLSLRGFSEAIVTSGGVDLSEINPKTMDVKKVSGLKICGETLDADAFTGGYNLQIAFSTGYLAGKSV